MAASTPFDLRWLVSVSTPFGEFCGRSHSKRRHNSGGQLLASDGWKAEPQCRIFGHGGGGSASSRGQDGFDTQSLNAFRCCTTPAGESPPSPEQERLGARPDSVWTA
jgi:hypothetical protein